MIDQSEDVLYNIMFVISVAVLVAFVKRFLFLLVFVVLYNRRSVFINSVNCNKEFWESVFRLTVWLPKTQELIVF